MGRDGSIILSEHIWPFVHGFCFRSRSDRWCAIEPRGEGLGGGVRGQGGAQGGRRGEQYLERSGRRTPPPYNRPRSHRAATATFGRIGPSTFKRLARFLVTWLFLVAGLWLRLGCCDRSGAFRSGEEGDEGTSAAPEPSSQRKRGRLLAFEP